jgi:hypothetical protein
MPTVSVVIPTYNRAQWLPQTVDSVLNQTCRPLEVWGPRVWKRLPLPIANMLGPRVVRLIP